MAAMENKTYKNEIAAGAVIWLGEADFLSGYIAEVWSDK
jgi:hypothetical protein